jgi:hypothetical protein
MLMKMTEEIKIIEEESVIEENRTPAKVAEGSAAKKATDGKKKKKAGTSEKKMEDEKKEEIVAVKVEPKAQEVVAREEANDDSWNVVQLKRKV